MIERVLLFVGGEKRFCVRWLELGMVGPQGLSGQYRISQRIPLCSPNLPLPKRLPPPPLQDHPALPLPHRLLLPLPKRLKLPHKLQNPLFPQHLQPQFEHRQGFDRFCMGVRLWARGLLGVVLDGGEEEVAVQQGRLAEGFEGVCGGLGGEDLPPEGVLEDGAVLVLDSVY
jgi:hypothetical protein